MSLGTPLAVMLAIIFLVPGLIMKNMLRVLARYEPTSRKVELLECLTASCFNYLIGAFFVWYLLHVWPDGLDLRRPETVPHHAGYLFLWAAIVLVLPAILGLILGVAARKLSLRNFLSRFGVSILHPAPTAWDYAFARGKAYWARVMLRNGGIVEGLFDSNSLSSSSASDRDIFLETVYELKEETNEYEEQTQSAGVWISATEIQRIEFFEIEN